ncbi:MAG: cytidine deaminase [Bacteroidia bacterium]|jgi:cytidine deaminase|nr:cytidine deaminase [Bacteroidia bacterium]
MKEIKRESLLHEYASIDELSSADRELLQLAKEAVETSYAPYSKFHVGCALRLQNGVVIKGSNQENIAYPSGLCAERVAIFSAGATYPNQPVTTMAITVKAEEYEVKEPIMSCGACLQSMSEYEIKFKQPIRVILQGETGVIYVANGLRTFMPYMFWVDELKRK